MEERRKPGPPRDRDEMFDMHDTMVSLYTAVNELCGSMRRYTNTRAWAENTLRQYGQDVPDDLSMEDIRKKMENWRDDLRGRIYTALTGAK